MKVDFVSIANGSFYTHKSSASYTNQCQMQHNKIEEVWEIKNKHKQLQDQIKRLREEGVKITNEMPNFEKSSALELAALKILEGHIYFGETDYSLFDVIEDNICFLTDIEI